ncbi:MAG: OmpA family protein [Cyclobacteriaceae bacterium]|nr:OmpA family protein [Cyclobacteriaceae bacterium]
MKPHMLVLIAVLATSAAIGQSQDSLIYAIGTISNHSTKEAVSAKISYQSLPYGNIVGVLTGSEFSIPLYGNEKYSITVEAPGFAPAKYMLDPSTAVNGKVTQNVELGLPVPAATAAPTAHHVGKVMRLDALIFHQRSAVISPESYAELNTVADMLHQNPNMVIQLEGHTDTRGDKSLNLKLSQERVESVRNYLVRRGVSKSRIKLKAYGGTQPLSNENTEEAHKLNRRVEVRIIEN